MTEQRHWSVLANVLELSAIHAPVLWTFFRIPDGLHGAGGGEADFLLGNPELKDALRWSIAINTDARGYPAKPICEVIPAKASEQIVEEDGPRIAEWIRTGCLNIRQLEWRNGRWM